MRPKARIGTILHALMRNRNNTPLFLDEMKSSPETGHDKSLGDDLSMSLYRHPYCRIQLTLKRAQ